MRVDVPGDGVGMEFMDLYHRGHVDHLLNMPRTKASKINTVAPVVNEETDAATGTVIAQGNLAEQPLQSDKVQKDKTLENA